MEINESYKAYFCFYLKETAPAYISINFISLVLALIKLKKKTCFKNKKKLILIIKP